MNSTLTPPWQRGFAPLTGSATLVLFLIANRDAASRSRCCRQQCTWLRVQRRRCLHRQAPDRNISCYQHRLAVKTHGSDSLKMVRSLKQVCFLETFTLLFLIQWLCWRWTLRKDLPRSPKTWFVAEELAKGLEGFPYWPVSPVGGYMK